MRSRRYSFPKRNRGTLCISSQAGCALECTFCSTGRQGFNRNLTVAEIIGQLWLANRDARTQASSRRERPITNVVMMGMGEPLANFDNVVAALHLMLDDDAYGLSRRRVTLSTSGWCRRSIACATRARWRWRCRCTRPTMRCADEIVPINKKYPLKELLAACVRYLDTAPRDFITFEYVMLAGVNDSTEHARQLAKLLKTVPCKINLIPFNPFPDSGYVRSDAATVATLPRCADAGGISRSWCARRAATTSMPRAASSPGRCRTRRGAAQKRAAIGNGYEVAHEARLIERVIAVRLLLGMCGCAGTGAESTSYAPPEPSPIRREMSRARIHTELAAGYLGARQLRRCPCRRRAKRSKRTPTMRRHSACWAWCTWNCATTGRRKPTSSARCASPRRIPTSTITIGWFLCQRKREQESIKYFLIALRNPLYPTPDKSWVNAGVCARQAGRYRSGRRLFPESAQSAAGAAAGAAAARGHGVQAQELSRGQVVPDAHSARGRADAPNCCGWRCGSSARSATAMPKASLAFQLRKNFPDSREARALAAGLYE